MTESTGLLSGEIQDPVLAAEDSESRAKVAAAVKSLPWSQRQLIELTFFEKVSWETAANWLDLNPSQALRCLLRAQVALNGQLQELA